jgi:hypothetical protein
MESTVKSLENNKEEVLRLPRWLLLLLVAGVIGLALLMAQRDFGRESLYLEELYVQKGEVLIRSLTTAMRLGWTQGLSRESLAAFNDHLENTDVTYLAVTDVKGRLVSSSVDPRQIPLKAFQSPDDPPSFQKPPMEPHRLVATLPSGRKIFWVYRPLWFTFQPPPPAHHRRRSRQDLTGRTIEEDIEEPAAKPGESMEAAPRPAAQLLLEDIPLDLPAEAGAGSPAETAGPGLNLTENPVNNQDIISNSSPDYSNTSGPVSGLSPDPAAGLPAEAPGFSPAETGASAPASAAAAPDSAPVSAPAPETASETAPAPASERASDPPVASSETGRPASGELAGSPAETPASSPEDRPAAPGTAENISAPAAGLEAETDEDGLPETTIEPPDDRPRRRWMSLDTETPPAQPPWPEDLGDWSRGLYCWVGFDMTPLEAAARSARLNTILFSGLLGAAALGGLLA